MNLFTTLGVSLLVIMAFTNAQNMDNMEVETRDNPSAYLRQKRQVILNNEPADALLPSSGCFWSGSAPFCLPACGNSYQATRTDKRGNGRRCWTGSKTLCCPLPAGTIKVGRR